MLPILLANFIVQILPILLIIAGVLLVLKARGVVPGASIHRCLGISLVSLPVGMRVCHLGQRVPRASLNQTSSDF
jgi:hypothetical protein